MKAKTGNTTAKASPRSILLWVLFWVYSAFTAFLVLLPYIHPVFLSFFTAKQDIITGTGFLCTGFVLIIVAVSGLPKVRYEAVSVFFCLALLARWVGFAVTFFSTLFNRNSFWLLPVGDAGTLLFYLIVSGGLELAGKVCNEKTTPLLLCLIPVVCYLVPAGLLIAGFTGNLWPAIYSFIYVTPPAITIMLVIRHWPAPGMRGIFITLILLAIADLTPFLSRLPTRDMIPGQLPTALAVMGLILFALSVIRRGEEFHG